MKTGYYYEEDFDLLPEDLTEKPIDEIKKKIRTEAIDGYTSELKSRLLDAIPREYLESMKNLINDVAEMLKEKMNE